VNRLRRLAPDLTPLRRYPPYRRLWMGVTVSVIGSQLTAVAVQIQVYDLTHSSFAVGLAGLVAFVGLAGFGLYGGAIADAVDRRRLTLCTSSALALCSLALALYALTHHHAVWPLYLVVFLQAGLFGIDSPARGAMLPRLLPTEVLPAANALSQVGFNLGLTVGPVLAGGLVATVGFGAAYGVDAASFLVAVYAVWRLPPMPPARFVSAGAPPQRRPVGPSAVAEGLRFLRGQPVLLMSFLVDIDAMVFGMPRALFPALSRSFFHGGPATVGLLNAAPAIGALTSAAVGGWVSRVRRQGVAVCVAIAVWGAAIAAFGFTRTLWLGMLALAVAGAADNVSAVFRSTILQVVTPDALRGRLQGVFIVVVSGGPRLGDLEAGAVAALSSPFFSVVSGGLACIAGVGLLAAAVPAFVRYDAARGARRGVPWSESEELSAAPELPGSPPGSPPG